MAIQHCHVAFFQVRLVTILASAMFSKSNLGGEIMLLSPDTFALLTYNSKPQCFGWNKFSRPPEGNVIWAWMRALQCLESLLSEASFRNGPPPRPSRCWSVCVAASIAIRILKRQKWRRRPWKKFAPRLHQLEIEVLQMTWMWTNNCDNDLSMANNTQFDPICIDTSKML